MTGRFKQIDPPPEKPMPERPTRAARDHSLIGYLIVMAIIVAMLGFITHLYVDLFDATWDLWAKLID